MAGRSGKNDCEKWPTFHLFWFSFCFFTLDTFFYLRRSSWEYSKLNFGIADDMSFILTSNFATFDNYENLTFFDLCVWQKLTSRIIHLKTDLKIFILTYSLAGFRSIQNLTRNGPSWPQSFFLIMKNYFDKVKS